jgi:hypothetical protein
MARYMLSVHSVEGEVREPPTAEEMAHNWQQLRIVEAEMNSTGAWVFSARLHDPDTATVVRVANGVIMTTDGPFAEAREHLGGFYVIKRRRPRHCSDVGVESYALHRLADRGASICRFRG